MTTITVRNVGAYGFNATPLNGIGLSTAEATTTRSKVEQALALADALRDAMGRARSGGVQAFAPAQTQPGGASYVTLPSGLSAGDRDDLFAKVMGHAWAGGPVSLDQWSHAVDALEQWAGATASMLPPGAGGGTRNVRGTWYVNGEPWSLSELFTVNRVNTLSEIDRMVADSLNVIAANNEAAKTLTGLMEKLFKKYYDNDWDYANITKNWVDFAGQYTPTGDSWTLGNTRGDAYSSGPADWPITYDQLSAYATRHIGPNALIVKLFSTGNTGYGKDDFRAMIDEVEQIIGAFSADNQVAQLRNETLFNSRSNLLEGLGTFLKGQQSTRSTVARNA